MNRLLLTLVCLAGVVGLALADHNCDVQFNYCQRGDCHDTAAINTWQNPTCVCPPGYAGAQCDYITTECTRDKPCQNGGTCAQTTCRTSGGSGSDGSCYTCSCPVGFSGTRGCNQPNGCLTKTCHSGAPCTFVNGVPTDAKCLCGAAPNSTWHYALPLCDLALSFDCTLPQFQCQNGGSCAGGPNCLCSPQFQGPACEDVNFCQSNTCYNGGTCQPGTGTGGHCDCLTLYTGNNCELLPFCHPSAPQCQNGGTCNAGTYATGSCTCPPGFWGKYCENVYAPEGCAVTGCSNGGSCRCTKATNTASQSGNCVSPPTSQTPWDTVCHCQTGFGDCLCNSTVVDNKCPDATNSDLNPCQHGGTCVTHANGYVCQCRAGFYGNACENYDNICHDGNPCQNNGRCSMSYAYSASTSAKSVRPGRGYAYAVCDCPYPFYGERCENRASVETLCWTDANPCLNGGNCTVRAHDRGYWVANGLINLQRTQLPPYLCNCPNGTYGNECESLTAPYYDTCQNNPSKCQNGGTCYNTGSGLSAQSKCACKCGWAGDNCEVASNAIVNGVNTNANVGGMLSFCTGQNPCNNGGSCYDDVKGTTFFCVCMAGWWGTTCQYEGRSASALVAPSIAVSLIAIALAYASRRQH